MSRSDPLRQSELDKDLIILPLKRHNTTDYKQDQLTAILQFLHLLDQVLRYIQKERQMACRDIIYSTTMVTALIMDRFQVEIPHD